MDSATLEVTVSDSVTTATIGAGEDQVKFYLHGGTPDSIAADLQKIAESHGCTSVRISETTPVATLLGKVPGLTVETIQGPETMMAVETA